MNNIKLNVNYLVLLCITFSTKDVSTLSCIFFLRFFSHNFHYLSVSHRTKKHVNSSRSHRKKKHVNSLDQYNIFIMCGMNLEFSHYQTQFSYQRMKSQFLEKNASTKSKKKKKSSKTVPYKILFTLIPMGNKMKIAI